MAGSSKKNAKAQKNSGPTGNDKPGKSTQQCALKQEPPKDQIVTPAITLVDPFVWYHEKIETDKNTVGKLVLKATKEHDELGYNGNGTLTADNTNVAFYSDRKCTNRVDPTTPVTYSFGSLLTGVTLYYTGTIYDTTELTLTLDPPTDDRITVNGPATADPRVRKPNIVTPTIQAEYKIVLFDNKLSDKQAAGETKILPTPTYILLSATQTLTNGGRAFTKKGKLEFTPANVEAFTDEACTKKLDDMELTADLLTGDDPYKVWLRGKTEGKFTVKLTLEDPGRHRIRRDKNPAELEMGVVKLELKLHQYLVNDLKDAGMQVDPDTDPESTYYTNLKNKQLPDQKVMADADKIGAPAKGDAAKPGRLLHLQDSGNFGRAKLIVTKVKAADVPDGCDDYDIVLNTGRGSAPDSGGDAVKPEELWGGDKDTPKSGDLDLYDAEFDGNEKDKWSFKLSALKTADQTVWVEGTDETAQPCDIRLDVGVDRAEDDKEPDKTVKRNGDWTRYTVVKIEEVKLLYPTSSEPNPPAPQYDSGKKEFYINFKADPDGRKVTIEAKLTKQLKNVPLYFMLAPDKDNKKTANWGIDLPTTWKWNGIEAAVKHLDKADRKDFLHLTAKTDDKGKASKELTLSRFGGDKFQPAAYLEQDPHLAKYVEGQTDLEKRKPVLAADKIIVWRKFWYREVKVEGITVAGFGNAADTYDAVKTTMTAAPVVTVSRSDANSISPAVIYKKHMIRYFRNTVTNQYVNSYPNDTGDALIVGDANESSFMGRVTADPARPVEIPIMNVHGLWIGDGLTGQISPGWKPFTGTYLELVADKKLLNPPLQGGTLLKAGTWQAVKWDAGANSAAGAWVPVTPTSSGNLAANMISLDPARNDPRAFRIAVPITPGPQVRVSVNLQLRGAASFLGTSYDDGIVNCYTPNDVVDFINTINHEIGHSFKQVAKVRPTGVPAHPHQYDKSGSHCRYVNNSCLMYESGPQAVHLDRFCPVCHPYVLVQVMRTK